jgi:D-cysteine desulfhydrase
MPRVSLREFPPRFALADLPTPVQRLERLSAYLGGPRILMKRDDMTGLAFGGNKTRKLEFLVADALARGADTLLTAGAAQSNHCRQTAAAAAKAGKRCDLVLGGAAPSRPEGNLLLDTLLGARIHWAGSDRRGETLEDVASSLKKEGLNPCVIPYGGSSPLGAAGYVMAMAELEGQLPAEEIRVDAMVFASSSGGTHAGLIAGALAFGYTGRILGVCVEKEGQGEGTLSGSIMSLARGTARLLGVPDLVTEEIRVSLDHRYAGEGYGVPGRREREAIRLLARLEGIFLDPVYTAKAMGGLIDMIARGEFTTKENVLFWHTGGTPALFASAGDLA